MEMISSLESSLYELLINIKTPLLEFWFIREPKWLPLSSSWHDDSWL